MSPTRVVIPSGDQINRPPQPEHYLFLNAPVSQEIKELSTEGQEQIGQGEQTQIYPGGQINHLPLTEPANLSQQIISETSAEGQGQIVQLRNAIMLLVESLPKPNDPMAKLEKFREKLTKLITFIGGMSTMSTIVSIPGGLDANGHIHFRDELTFYFFFVLAEITFLLSVANHTIISTDPEESLTQEQKIKSMKTRLVSAQVILWITCATALGAYSSAFLLIYPDSSNTTIIKAKDFVRREDWPRRSAIIFCYSKFVGCLIYSLDTLSSAWLEALLLELEPIFWLIRCEL